MCKEFCELCKVQSTEERMQKSTFKKVRGKQKFISVTIKWKSKNVTSFLSNNREI